MKTSSAASRIKANLQELFQANLTPGEAYIRFQLSWDMTALLSTEQVEESLVVEADRITPLPNMPDSIIGIMSSRDRVFCVFDLAQLFSLSSGLINPRQYQVIVLQTNEETPIYIGLAVNRLQGMVRLPVEKIQSSLDGVAANIASYVSGTVQQAETTIPILEFNRILEALTIQTPTV